MPKASRDIVPAYEKGLQARRGLQPVVRRCAFCPDWWVEGTVGDTAVLVAAHRREAHPHARQRTKFSRQRAGIRTIGTKTLGENIAANRLQGASMWATVTDIEGDTL